MSYISSCYSELLVAQLVILFWEVVEASESGALPG